MEWEQVITICPLFSGLSLEEMEKIEAVALQKKYEKKEVIFSEGEEAKGFFLVIKGRVKIYKISAEGKEKIIYLPSVGETFAEAALFSGGKYPAYAEPLTYSTLLFFPKDRFIKLIEDNPQLSLNMLGTLSQFLHKYNRMIEELSFQDVSSRLARYFIVLWEKGGKMNDMEVELDMNKTQLASHLGTISETLSRTLKKFKDNNLIHVRKNHIQLIDYDKIEAISWGQKM